MKRRLLLAFAVLLLAIAAIANAANIDLGGSVSTTGTAILGAASVVFASDANHTLSVAEYTNDFLEVTSGVSLSVQRSLIAPLVQGQQFIIQNATTGGQSILVIGASGAGVVIPNGGTQSVVCDGTNYLPAGGTPLAWPIQVADGGTGNATFAEGGLLVGNNQAPLYQLTCATGQAPVGSATGMVCGTVAAASQASQSITASGGNVTCSGTTAAETCTVNNTSVSANSYGSSTQVGTFTVGADGRLTAASNVTISGTSPGGAPGGDLCTSPNYPSPTVCALTGTGESTLPVLTPCTTLNADSGAPVISCVYSSTTTGTIPSTIYTQVPVGCTTWSVATEAHDPVYNFFTGKIPTFGTCWDGGAGAAIAKGTPGAAAILSVYQDPYMTDAGAWWFVDASYVGVSQQCPNDGGTPGTVCGWSTTINEQVRQ